MSAVFDHAQSINANVQPEAPPAYAFLAHPPPEKKRPTEYIPAPPTPCRPRNQSNHRRRSATVSAISAWVSAVQPGSPAPRSPHRRSSISSRRSSASSPRVAARRGSVTASSPYPPSASFLNFLDTPTVASRSAITPSVKDFKPDLTAVGYTSVFVHFPDTPLSAAIPINLAPAPVRPPPSLRRVGPPSPSSPVRASRGIRRFRSLGVLKPIRTARSKSAMRGPSSPLAPSPTSKSHAGSRAKANAMVTASKKSKYAKFRPPPLANELALAQLADGGSLEEHIRRFAEAQAKANGSHELTRDGKLVGVGDVWRDGAGGLWRDQDEEWEYAHLLGGEADWCGGDETWVRFSPVSADGQMPRKPSVVASLEGSEEEIRRGSLSSQDSDLDPRYTVQPEDVRDDLAAFGSALAPVAARRPGMSVLAIPSRSSRAGKHLRKPEFLLEVFPVPSSPTTAAPCPAPSQPRRKPALGKPRTRPAPLTLTPPSPAFKCPTNPLDTERAREDFIHSSFAPPTAPAPVLSPRLPLAPRSATKGTFGNVPTQRSAVGVTRFGVRGLLRAMGGKKGEL